MTALKKVLEQGPSKRITVGRVVLFLWIFILGVCHYLYAASGKINALGLLIALVVSSAFAVAGALLLEKLVRWLQERAACVDVKAVTCPQRRDAMLLFLLMLIPLLVWWIAFFPGGFSDDSVLQLAQAQSGEYSDWHPVIHTLLVFTLPLALTGGQIGAIVLFQIVEVALVITYAAFTVARVASKRFAYLFVGALVLNPVTCSICMYPWKDVAFALAATLLVSMAVRMWLDEEWVQRPQNVVALAVVLAFGCLVRHNGVLFMAPMAIVLFFVANRRRMAQAGALCILLVLLVRVPVYGAMGVQSPGQRAVELTGLPLSVIGAVMNDDIDAVDDDIKELMYAAVPEELWENYKVNKGFNSVKFYKDDVNLDALEEAGAGTILKYALRAAKISPMAAFRGIFAITQMVYSLDEPISWTITPRELTGVKEESGIVTTGPKVLREALQGLLNASRSGVLSNLIWHIGWIELVLLAMFVLYSKQSKAALFALPLFVHNMGTSLLLTGVDFRFFWLTFPVGFALMICLPIMVGKGRSVAR